MHHEALASDYLKASALRRHLCRMYVILCISGSLLVLAACDRLNIHLVYALARRRFFCRLPVARLFGTSFPVHWIRGSVAFDHERLDGIVGLGAQT